jgi:hypothetical protein
LEFNLHEVVTSRDQTLIKDLICQERKPGQSGKLKIIADERQADNKNNEELIFQIKGNFASDDGMNFFLVHKFISNQVYKPLYKSEIMASQAGQFTWKQHAILTSELANEDVDREIRLEFFKSQKSGTHTNLGYINFTLGALREGTRDFPIMKRGMAVKNCNATFTVANFNKRHSFLEYVFGGCEI